MPVNSLLSPEKIVGGRKVSPSSFQNFVSGGAPLGSSVVSSAANNVVGFQRASVKPAKPDLNSIVNTISSNILSQVSDKIESIVNISNKNVDVKIKEVRSEIIREIQPLYTKQENNITRLQVASDRIIRQSDSSISKIAEDYKKKVSEVDAAKPTGILGNFLKVFKGALDFIQFFASKKNLDNLDSNLKSLQKIFSDSFEVAKLIRNTINKIVEQLSNLPTASPSRSPGLNVDLKIPGQGLKKTAPRGLSNLIRRGGMFALGAGALAAGAGAVNALSDTGVQPVKQEPGFFGGLVEGLGGIIDSFTAAVNSLIKGSNDRSGGGGGGGGGVTTLSQFDPSSPDPGGPSSPTPELTGTGKEGVIEYAKKAGFSEEFTAGLVANVSAESGGNPFAYNPNDYGQPSYGAFQFRAGRGDNMIKYLEQNGIPNAKSIFTNPNDPRRKDKEIQQKALSLQIKYFTEVEKDQATPRIKAAQKSTNLREVQDAFFAGERFEGYNDPNSRQYKSRAEKIQKVYQELKKSGQMRANLGRGGADLPDFVLSPEKRQELKNMAANVSQPPPSQAAPSVNVLPLDMSTQMQQQVSSSSGSPSSGPSAPSGQKGPTAPFLPAGNNDNFLILYSKIIYNIVDG